MQDVEPQFLESDSRVMSEFRILPFGIGVCGRYRKHLVEPFVPCAENKPCVELRRLSTNDSRTKSLSVLSVLITDTSTFQRTYEEEKISIGDSPLMSVVAERCSSL